MKAQEMMTTEYNFIQDAFQKLVNDKKLIHSKFESISRLTGDASSRVYYRLKTNEGSYVVCQDNLLKEQGENYLFKLVHSFLEKNKVRVPHLYDANKTDGLIVEEDLGDFTFLNFLSGLRSNEEELKAYTRMIDLMISMHKMDVPKDQNLIFNKLKFDEEKLMSEVDFTIKHFLVSYLKCSDLSVSNIVVQNFQKICAQINKYEMVFTHRDFHSRNVMVLNNDLVVIDFQDARLGLPQYDLVSLLEDCYYQINQENKEKLIDYYWNQFCFNLDQKSKKNFLYLYDLMTLQRCFKAIGTFSYIHKLRNDIRYLKYIGFAFEKIRLVMMKYPEFSELKKVLSTTYYAN